MNIVVSSVHIVFSSVFIAPLHAHMFACNRNVHDFFSILNGCYVKNLVKNIWLKYMMVHIVISSMHISQLCAPICSQN